MAVVYINIERAEILINNLNLLPTTPPTRRFYFNFLKFKNYFLFFCIIICLFVAIIKNVLGTLYSTI